jgi:hypothetical protein
MLADLAIRHAHPTPFERWGLDATRTVPVDESGVRDAGPGTFRKSQRRFSTPPAGRDAPMT